MKIRTRLLLALIILVGLGMYKLVDWFLADVRPRYHEAMEESMVDIATVLSALLSAETGAGAKPSTDALRQALDEAGQRRFDARIRAATKTRMDLRVYVTDVAGIVVYDSDGGRDEGRDYSQWNDVIRTLRGEYGARTTRVNPEDPLSSVFYVASPVLLDGRIAGVLTVAKKSDNVAMFVTAAKRKMVYAGVIAALAVILFGGAVSLWITRPIGRLTRYARDVRDGRRPPAPSLGHSELGELGRAFEEMRDALEGKQYVEDYVQALTHEMKSPLSAVRAAAELLQEDLPAAQRERFLGNIIQESGRMQDLVDRMLQLSALESRKRLRDVADVPIPATVDESLASIRPIAERKGVAIAWQPGAPLVVKGEHFLIRQSIVNLLQNAVEFTPAGGMVTVEASAADGGALIVISDTGPGVPEYALARVFDRFYSLRRPDTGLKSSGLGLTFVREAAALHGGTVRLENIPQGAKASLFLPYLPAS